MEPEVPREPMKEETEQAAQFSTDAGPDDGRAWEEIAAGRYMPRRTKGSYKGRALG